MTLRELINMRKKKDACVAVDKFWKGYVAGWEEAYNDLEEILEQHDFDLGVLVIKEGEQNESL